MLKPLNICPHLPEKNEMLSDIKFQRSKIDATKNSEGFKTLHRKSLGEDEKKSIPTRPQIPLQKFRLFPRRVSLVKKDLKEKEKTDAKISSMDVGKILNRNRLEEEETVTFPQSMNGISYPNYESQKQNILEKQCVDVDTISYDVDQEEICSIAASSIGSFDGDLNTCNTKSYIDISFADLAQAAVKHTVYPYKIRTFEEYDKVLEGCQKRARISAAMLTHRLTKIPTSVQSHNEKTKENTIVRLHKAWAFYETAQSKHRIETKDNKMSLQVVNSVMYEIDRIQTKANARVIDIFHQLDDNNDGKISMPELVLLSKRFGIEMSKQDIAYMMQILDKDGNGSISYDELRQFMKMYRQRLVGLDNT